jgi:hypothetical protein
MLRRSISLDNRSQSLVIFNCRKLRELCFGTGTFGGNNEFFEAWGATDIAEATQDRRHLHGSRPQLLRHRRHLLRRRRSESVLGKAIAHLKREDVLISTKATFRFGDGPNDVGSSRYHLIQALEGSLKRLGTDYIDVYHMHAFDALTPVEETSTRSTSSSAKARSATSPAPTSPAGT